MTKYELYTQKRIEENRKAWEKKLLKVARSESARLKKSLPNMFHVEPPAKENKTTQE